MVDSNFVLSAAELTEASDIKDLHERVARSVRRLGCDHFLLGLEVRLAAGPSLQHVDSGYPDMWQRRYIEKGYIRVDPTIGYCQTHKEPIVWSPTLYSERTFALMEESRAHGLGHGLSVPVHQGNDIKSMFSMARDQAFTDSREEQLLMAGGQLLANMAHVAMQRFVVPQLLEQVRPELSARELQCLQLCAEGKSNGVIGDVLHLSERNVEYHLSKVLKKLGVVTRVQAVAMGIQLRLIP